MTATQTATARPIAFIPQMVGAIQDDRKHSTRRVVTADIPDDADEVFAWFGGELRNAPDGCAPDGLWARKNGADGYLRHLAPCPFGAPGDRLWVKEQCWLWGRWLEKGTIGRSGRLRPVLDGHVSRGPRTTYTKPETTVKRNGTTGWAYRHARYMPRCWASRILLEIVSIRVERLQAITETDALMEGFKRLPATGRVVLSPGGQYAGNVWSSIAWGLRSCGTLSTAIAATHGAQTHGCGWWVQGARSTARAKPMTGAELRRRPSNGCYLRSDRAWRSTAARLVSDVRHGP